jgi:hypothetical protein
VIHEHMSAAVLTTMAAVRNISPETSRAVLLRGSQRRYTDI